MARKARGKKDHTILIVIIVASVIVLLLAWLFPTVFSSGEEEESITAVPTVTTVVRAQDGQSHSVQADISLDLTGEARDSTDAATLQGKITEIISTMDYDKIQGEGSTKYIKNTIANGLGAYVPPDSINGVYITSLKTGDAVVIEEKTPEQKKSNTVVKGLFQNVKN